MSWNCLYRTKLFLFLGTQSLLSVSVPGKIFPENGKADLSFLKEGAYFLSFYNRAHWWPKKELWYLNHNQIHFTKKGKVSTL